MRTHHYILLALVNGKGKQERTHLTLFYARWIKADKRNKKAMHLIILILSGKKYDQSFVRQTEDAHVKTHSFVYTIQLVL